LDLLRRSLLFVTSRSAEWPNCLLWWSDDRSWLTALDHAGDQFLSQGVGDASVRPEAGEVVQFVGIGLQVVSVKKTMTFGRSTSAFVWSPLSRCQATGFRLQYREMQTLSPTQATVGEIPGLVLTWGRIYGYVPYRYRALTGMLHFCNLASSRRV
jgi:hypothetical protein